MSSSRLGLRERELLYWAVVHGWQLHFDHRGRCQWEGDRMLPFRADATLRKLVSKGLMQEIKVGSDSIFRATSACEPFKCRACQRGRIYDMDTEIGKCPACDGLSLLPKAKEPK